MATDSTFYDCNWTVLNKMIYLEHFFKENSIDLETISFTIDENNKIIIHGTTIDGKEISINTNIDKKHI